MTVFTTLAWCLVAPLLVLADIQFVYPAGGEIIDASNTKYIDLEWCESGISPNISQLYNYTIRLYSGSDASPVLVPATIINEKGTMPGAEGDATNPKTAMNQIMISNLDLTSLNSTPNSYFFGVASKFRPLANGTDPGVTELSFSSRFSLKSASVDINATYAAMLPTGGPQRLFFCTGSVAACTPPADLVIPVAAVATSPKFTTTAAEEKAKLNKFLAGYIATGVIVMGTVLILIFVLGRSRRDKMRVLGGGASGEKKGRIRGLAAGMGMVVGGAGVAGKQVPDYEKWDIKRVSEGSDKGWNAGAR